MCVRERERGKGAIEACSITHDLKFCERCTSIMTLSLSYYTTTDNKHLLMQVLSR